MPSGEIGSVCRADWQRNLEDFPYLCFAKIGGGSTELAPETGLSLVSVFAFHYLCAVIIEVKCMETTRQNKIARLLQKELSDIFLLQAKALRGTLVSVSAVRISPDLSVARAYLSIFPSDKGAEILNNVNANMKSIRYELGTRVRHQLRIIPELKFFLDDSLDYLEHIDELLGKQGV